MYIRYIYVLILRWMGDRTSYLLYICTDQICVNSVWLINDYIFSLTFY